MRTPRVVEGPQLVKACPEIKRPQLAIFLHAQ